MATNAHWLRGVVVVGLLLHGCGAGVAPELEPLHEARPAGEVSPAVEPVDLGEGCVRGPPCSTAAGEVRCTLYVWHPATGFTPFALDGDGWTCAPR